MTTPTARSLIQRLADALTAHHQLPGRVPLINEARAYLLHPVDLSHLSDAEHNALCPQGYHAPDGPAVPDGREPASVAYEPSDAELHDLWLELYRFHDGATSGEVATIARAALERWGGRTPAPILLSERQPTEADCDAEGHCWWWHPETHECVACWCYSRGNGTEKLWLPHWALPVPGVEA